MAIGITTYVALGLLAWGLWYLLNSPIPKGYHDPWKLRLIFAVLKILHATDYIMGFFKEDAKLMIQTRKFLVPAHNQMIASLPVKSDTHYFDGVMVKLYRPEGLKANNNPGIMFYHGGGWIAGDIAFMDDFCCQFAYETNAVTCSVEYRLAPEHVYPAALDDCVKATRFFMKEAEKFAVDPSRVALMGDSAGGNLAAATALKLRDMKVEPQPKLQVLIYPCLQATDMRTPSYQANAGDPLLPATNMIKFWHLYATGDTKYLQELLQNQHTPVEVKKKLFRNQLNHEELFKERRDINYVPCKFSEGKEHVWDELKEIFMDPYYAPLMSQDLSGLPEAIILTAEQDVLKADGLWYSKYLEKFGIPVTYKHIESGYHGFVSVPFPEQEDTKQARKYLHSQVKSML